MQEVDAEEEEAARADLERRLAAAEASCAEADALRAAAEKACREADAQVSVEWPNTPRWKCLIAT